MRRPALGWGPGPIDSCARYYHPGLGRFISPDTLILNPANPQGLNRYAYVHNNPLRYTDPSGHWVETAIDVVSLGLTLNDIRREGFTFWNTVSLVTDIASLVLPVVPAGASHIIRAAKWANRAVNVGDTAADAARILSRADEVADVARALSRADDVADAARVLSRTDDVASQLANATDDALNAAQSLRGSKRELPAPDAQSLIDDIVQTELKNVRLSQYPQYQPAMPLSQYGRAAQSTYTHIGPLAVKEGRVETVITIVHEEMHHRLWARGVPTSLHHPYVENVAQRFARLKGLK